MAEVTAQNGSNEKKFLLPWMPYIFGFIFVLGVAGFILLFSQKSATAAESSIAAQNPSEQVVRTVRTVLDDIKAKKFKEAYSKGSSDFKVSMAYDAFYQFLQPYDALQEWSSATYSTPQIGSEIAALVAYLHYDEEKETLPISFTLIKEEEQWKIYGFVLNREDLEVPIQQMEQLKELTRAVNQDLAYLSKENFMAAYYKMSSKRFQQEHSYEAFVRYIQGMPIFSEQQGATLFDGSVEGDTEKLKVSLYSEEETVPIQFGLVQEEGKWKIDSFTVLASPTVQKPMKPYEVESSLQVIELFLSNLRERQVEKAYNLFTSEGFQQSTPLELFTTFIEDHPILQEKAAPEFVEGGKEGEERILYLFYPHHPYSTAFEVKLVEEAGDWKIQALSIEAPPGLNPGDVVEKGEALDLIQHVLDLIGTGSYERFYDEETTRGFKNTTSFEDFKSYLQNHPVLEHDPKVFVQEIVQDRDQLFLETELLDDTHSYSALFVFLFENGKWKVLRMETKAEERLPYAFVVALVNLSQILVGQTINDDGMVQDSGQPLTEGNEPIYVNILLTSNSPQGRVDLYLTHEESASQTFPVTGIAEDEGNNILTFSFTPPLEGWPNGRYRAIAKTDNNQSLEVSFLVDHAEEDADWRR